MSCAISSARQAAVRVASLFLALAWTASAGAHAFPKHAEPPAGAILSAAPREVLVRFDRILEPAFTTLRVLDASGKRVDQGDAHLLSTDARVVRVGLSPLGPGTYRVRWIAVERDGHRTEGDYSFTIR
ncbi:MAG: copper resistance protein CopC [Myxococcota bacterium]